MFPSQNWKEILEKKTLYPALNIEILKKKTLNDQDFFQNHTQCVGIITNASFSAPEGNVHANHLYIVGDWRMQS